MMTLNADWDSDETDRDVCAWLGGASGRLQYAQACDLATWLPDDLLIKFDRMAMAHSLEGRAPFLSPEMVQAGLDLPAELKMSEGVSKALLRKAASQLLPEETLRKPKQGFVLPMRSWLAQWFDAHGGPAAFFNRHEVPGIDPNAVAQMVTRSAETGSRRERFIFAVVMLHLWRNRFDDRRRALRSKLFVR